jgi:hypothetical protein
MPDGDCREDQVVPFKDNQEVGKRLLESAPLTDEEIRDLMRFNQIIDDKGQRRLYVELSLQNLAAIRKFEETSGKLSERLLYLTWVIAFLTLVTAVAATLAAVPAFHYLCGK